MLITVSELYQWEQHFFKFLFFFNMCFQYIMTTFLMRNWYMSMTHHNTFSTLFVSPSLLSFLSPNPYEKDVSLFLNIYLLFYTLFIFWVAHLREAVWYLSLTCLIYFSNHYGLTIYLFFYKLLKFMAEYCSTVYKYTFFYFFIYLSFGAHIDHF